MSTLFSGVGVLAGTLGAAVKGVGVANATSAPSKKPSMGTPMEAEIYSAVGRYTKRGSSSPLKKKIYIYIYIGI